MMTTSMFKQSQSHASKGSAYKTLYRPKQSEPTRIRNCGLTLMFAWLSKLEPLPLIPVMRMIISKPAMPSAKPSRPQNPKEKKEFTHSSPLPTTETWQGLHNITDYKDRKHPATYTSTSLSDKLNALYTRFEVSGSSPTQSSPSGRDF